MTREELNELLADFTNEELDEIRNFLIDLTMKSK